MCISIHIVLQVNPDAYHIITHFHKHLYPKVYLFFQSISYFYLSSLLLYYKVCIFVYSKICLKRPLKIDKTKILMTNGSLMKVKSIAECSPWSNLQYF